MRGIFGVGVDLVTPARVAAVHRKHPRRFADRMLHPKERAEFEQAKRPELFLAKSFAAKEAFAKALGTGFRGLAHDEVGLVRGKLGRPELVFGDKLKRRLARMKAKHAHVSISDEGDLIIAVVILEK